MELFGFTIARTKAIPLQPLSGRGGWWRVISEPSIGAWQRNEEINTDTVLTNAAVYACVSMIAQDIGKLNLRLVQLDASGIWTEAESHAFSPVLRKPNHYQTRIEFIEQWVMSKLTTGNAYILKKRDNRGGSSQGVVNAMYVLDPSRVIPLVATSGDVYYELRRDDLSGLRAESVTVPARDISHDRMVPLYHPLVGVSPIYASAAAAMQGISIQSGSKNFFGNGSMPGGILTAPRGITNTQAEELKTKWETEFGGDNAGKIAVLGGELQYTQLGMNAVDAQLIDQLRWTDERVCSCFHVPPFLVDIGPPPPYANFEPLIQKYSNQCLQSLIVKIESCLDEELPKPYGTEFDVTDLFWMDANAKSKAAMDGIAGGLTYNEARQRFHGVGPVAGGDSPLVQQQYYSLTALAKRDAGDPFAASSAPEQSPPPDSGSDPKTRAAAVAALLRKGIANGLYAA